MSEYSDKELIDLFRNGSNANYAFNLIVQKHQRKLYHVIRRLVIDHDDTNDLLQNTFLKLGKGKRYGIVAKNGSGMSSIL